MSFVKNLYILYQFATKWYNVHKPGHPIITMKGQIQ